MTDYLIVKRGQLKVDGWTGGDWRQYVAFLDDKSAYCVRHSGLTGTVFFIGIALLLMAGMGVFIAWNGQVEVYWERVIGIAVIGAVLLLPALITWLTPWRLVVKVSDKMLPDENGSYWRNI